MWDTVERVVERGPGVTRTPGRILITTFRMYSQDHCGTYAAAIAYYAIFSLLPLLLVIVSLFGLFVNRQDIVDFVFEQIPLEQTASVQQNVEDAVGGAQNISVAGLSFGLLLLLWSSSGMFGAVRKGLNATSHRAYGQSYLHGKVIDLGLIFAAGLLILLSIGLTALVQVAVRRAGDLGWTSIQTSPGVNLAYYGAPALASFTLFAMLYRFVPTSRPSWVEASAGAACATVLFELAKNLAAILIGNTAFSRNTALYASFGTALAFLFWMFVNASILLLGAEFARALRFPAEKPIESRSQERPAQL
jgi:membrane protein